MGVQNILCFNIISTELRFFIEFLYSSCVVMFLGFFLRRRATPWASVGSLWDAFVAPGLPFSCSGTTVLRFQHFLLFIILLIFMNSKKHTMFLRFLAYLGPRLVALGPPAGSREWFFIEFFLSTLVMGVQNILCFYIISTEP